VSMETFSGIARAVHADAAPDNVEIAKTALSFELDGRSVTLAPARDAQRCPIREGDRVVVVGHASGDRVIAYAYRNVSTGCMARASSEHDVIESVLVLAFCIAGGAVGWTLGNEIPLVQWVGRVTSVATGTLVGVLALMNLRSAGEEFRAEFILMRNALEIVRGRARDVGWHDMKSPEGHLQGPKTSLKLDGRAVELVGFGTAAIGEGDEVVMVGEQRGDVVSVSAYRNVSRAKAAAVTGFGTVIVSLFLLVAFAAALPVFWANRNAVGFLISLLLETVVACNIVKPTYQWMLRRQAYRAIRLENDAEAASDGLSS
jgi:hypothetical protein